METILALSGISRAFAGVQALSDVSFSIERGTVHALVGENGAGKSTLIKILSGALQPDAGEMLLAGQPYRPRNPRQAMEAGISTIHQELNLLPDRSVTQNVMLGKELTRAALLDRAAMHAQVSQVLAGLKAGHLPLDAPVARLRVGEKQVVEISKALVNRSRVLVMDEPTAALNGEEAEALFAIIEQLRAQGAAILYVSHRLDEVLRLADAITVLRDGRHIRTLPRAEVSREQMITDMIGRKLEGMLPERNRTLGDTVLKVEGLTQPGAFGDVSFALRAGEVLAITGLSGSGKTELGKALFGDWPIAGGTVWLFGRPVVPSPRQAVRSGVGYVAEDRKAEGVLMEVSVRRNLALPLLPRLASHLGVINRALEERAARRQVDSLDIRTPSLEQLVRNLSGGNQQKVSLGKWLATEARVLVMLEPTQGIDVAVKFEVYELISRLSRQGVAFVLVSSEIPEILGLAHRILVLHDGRVVAELDGERATSEEVLRYALGQGGPIGRLQ